MRMMQIAQWVSGKA